MLLTVLKVTIRPYMSAPLCSNQLQPRMTDSGAYVDWVKTPQIVIFNHYSIKSMPSQIVIFKF